MIQHIKIKSKRNLFIYLFIYSSCKNEKKSSIVLSKKKTGEWVLVKSAKIGKWENGIEYLYTQEELKRQYSDYIIILKKDDLLINSTKQDYSLCEGDESLIKETLDFNINGTDEDKKVVKKFLKKEFGLLEEQFKGVYNLNCETPFHTIFDFGDKLLVREWGTYYFLFTKKEEIKSVKAGDYNCKDIEIKNIYEEPLYQTCECDYDFSKCYNIFYNKSDDYYRKMLLANLPKKDTIAFFGNDFPYTEYKIYKKDSIGIKIQEEGGGMEYMFKKVDNKTVIDFYADPP